MKKLISLIFILCCSMCFGDIEIQGYKSEGINELWQSGGLILNSNKKHEISMYNVSPSIKSNQANFFFIIRNNSNVFFNLLKSDLTITDQNGNLLKIVSKDSVRKKINSNANNQAFIAALALGLSHASQPNAGESYYHSHTTGTLQCNSSHANYHSNNSGYIYNQAARNQQIHNNSCETQAVMNRIQSQENINLSNADDFYFDNMTIYPQTAVGFNLQIEIPKDLLNDLTSIHFFYTLDGEEHMFIYCVYESNPKKNTFYIWDLLGSVIPSHKTRIESSISYNRF